MNCEYNITLEFDNLWFMDIKHIPMEEISHSNLKYNKEILRIVKQIDDNTQRPLTKNLSKILKQDLSKFSHQDLSKSYSIKVTDSYLAKKFSFSVTMNEISLNNVEFKLNIKQSVYDEFLNSHQDLINYLNIVLERMFFNCFIYE